MKRSVITGSGNFIPSIIKTNSDFLQQQFFNEDGTPIPTKTDVIIDKFRKITGIEERRYLPAELNTSDMAAAAAKLAIEDSNIDPESLDLIIVAHNFGDVSNGSNQSDAVPSLANRVKNLLSIKKPTCIAFDVLFGCPGWLMALIQADAFFKAGIANKALIIGAETLSRVIDKYDRDSMIFSDGAGAIVLEYKDVTNEGVLSAGVLSHSGEELDYLYMDDPYYNETNTEIKFMKMKGRKVYEYALKHVPEAMKECLDKSGESILKRFLFTRLMKKWTKLLYRLFINYTM
jgi:3-oxoacyl-[acyl-carrier-protein] synthase III